MTTGLSCSRGVAGCHKAPQSRIRELCRTTQLLDCVSLPVFCETAQGSISAVCHTYQSGSSSDPWWWSASRPGSGTSVRSSWRPVHATLKFLEFWDYLLMGLKINNILILWNKGNFRFISYEPTSTKHVKTIHEGFFNLPSLVEPFQRVL